MVKMLKCECVFRRVNKCNFLSVFDVHISQNHNYCGICGFLQKFQTMKHLIIPKTWTPPTKNMQSKTMIVSVWTLNH